MNLRSVLLFLLGVISGPYTLAQLYPELAHSYVAPALLDVDQCDTKFVKSKQPLIFLTPFTEIFDVNHTGQSIDVLRMKHHPIGLAGTLRGGVLGDNVYSYFRTRFYWTDNTTECACSRNKMDGEAGNRLEILAHYMNRKYGTYENALKHSDGIVQVSAKIYVFEAALPNSLFDSFDYVSKKIRKPGEHHLAKSSSTFVWFIFYPQHTVYYAYRSTYTDEDTGHSYPSTTIVLSPNVANYISYRQFKDSFGALKNCEGKPMVNVAPRAPQGETTVVKSEGVTILNLKG